MPATHSNANLVQFVRSRMSGKWLLYINKSPEPEFRNYFLCGDFRDKQYDREFSAIIDEQVGIIRNEIYFSGFYRCVKAGDSQLNMLIPVGFIQFLRFAGAYISMKSTKIKFISIIIHVKSGLENLKVSYMQEFSFLNYLHENDEDIKFRLH